MKSNLLILVALLWLSIAAHAQQPPKEFFDGMDQLQKNPDEAKKDFTAAAAKMPEFHGTYHFLGVIALRQHKPDSALSYFIKSIALNEHNVNHTREMTYIRLISTYAKQQDFDDGFKTGWDALKSYPDSKMISNALRDLCMWAYYIKNNNLDPAYLSPDIKPEYVVKDIDEEYLILRNLRVNDNSIQVGIQSLVYRKKSPYDVFKCTSGDSKDEIEVDFKIDWDMNTYFGGMRGPTNEVSGDDKKPIYERAGAALVQDKGDIQSIIEKLMGK
jgi:tetratricopeptide (TPR) repeat protein